MNFMYNFTSGYVLCPGGGCPWSKGSIPYDFLTFNFLYIKEFKNRKAYSDGLWETSRFVESRSLFLYNSGDEHSQLSDKNCRAGHGAHE